MVPPGHFFREQRGVTEGEWSTHSLDVSNLADRQPNFRVRFGLISIKQFQFSGWNIDSLRLYG